jgi:O-antigen/teichoic acid export membrane protein
MSTFSREGLMRAAALVTGSTYVVYTVGLAANALVARSLGPADFGRYAYVVWLSGLLVVLSNHGLTTSAIRFISECVGREDAAGAASVERKLVRWNWLSAVGVSLAALLLLRWTLPQGWRFGLAAFGACLVVSVLGKAGFLMNVSVAKGFGRFSLEVKVNVVLSMLNLVVVFALLAAHSGLLGYIAWFTAMSVAYWAWSSWLLARRERSAAAPRDDGGALDARLRSHLRWTIVLVVLYGVGARSFETFLLNRFSTAEAIGYFSVAANLTRGGIDLLMSGLQTVLMPAMAHAYGSKSQDAVRQLLGSSLRYVLCLGFVAAGVGALLAQPAIALLYGPTYQPAIWVMQVFAVVGGLSLAEGVFGAYLSTTDNQRSRVLVLGSSVAISASLAVLFVPWLGLAGAVLSYVCGRICVIAFMSWLIIVKERVPVDWRPIGKLTAAALVAFVASYALTEFSDALVLDVVAAGCFVAIFMVLSVLLRTWRAEEYELVLGLVGRIGLLDSSVGALIRLAQRSSGGPRGLH